MYTTISNCAQIKYRTKPGGRLQTITTPPCTALLTTVDVSVQIMVSKSYAEVGEVFIYTFVFHNATDYTLKNLVCHDPMNNALIYVENSLIYNGVSLEQSQIKDSIELPDLLSNRSGVLQFKVYASELPDSDFVINSYYLTYDSITPYVDITSQSALLHAEEIIPPPTVTLYSNMVTTYLAECCLHLEQTPDTQTLTKDCCIHFDGTITNTGNTTLIDNMIELNFPVGTSYIPDSLYVNMIPVDLNEDNTFSIGTLQPDEILTYFYDLQVVVDLPEGDYTATAIDKGINSNQQSEHSIIWSNEVINHFTSKPSFEDLVLEISADCCSIEYGDTFSYTLSIYNPNDYVITDLLLADILSSELSYVPYSLKINDVNADLATFPDQIPLDELDALKTHTLTYDVKVLELPSTFSINNFFTLDYKYNTTSAQHRSDKSNTLDLAVTQHRLELSNSPDHLTLIDNDSIRYTGTLSNRSMSDCFATYIAFQLPKGASLISDSVRLNDQPTSFSTKNELYIGDILSDTTVTFCYSLKINAITQVTLVDCAVAYSSANDSCSTHPALLSNTVVNAFASTQNPCPSPCTACPFINDYGRTSSDHNVTAHKETPPKPLPLQKQPLNTPDRTIYPNYYSNTSDPIYFADQSPCNSDNSMFLLFLLFYFLSSN